MDEDSLRWYQCTDCGEINFHYQLRKNHGYCQSCNIFMGDSFPTAPFYLLIRFLKNDTMIKPSEEEKEKAKNKYIKPGPRFTYIYFLQIIGGERYIKIGKSMKPMERVKSIQTNSPYKLKILSIIPESNYKEAEVHKKFMKYRLKGEWFKPHKDIFRFIEENSHLNILK